ncbi:hypothetical protein FGB62_64g130 [Gracilaria domingensis]|nr:hypothetical protein FGB62_64g130 [Gracilaria domingensis]
MGRCGRTCSLVHEIDSSQVTSRDEPPLVTARGTKRSVRGALAPNAVFSVLFRRCTRWREDSRCSRSPAASESRVTAFPVWPLPLVPLVSAAQAQERVAATRGANDGTVS